MRAGVRLWPGRGDVPLPVTGFCFFFLCEFRGMPHSCCSPTCPLYLGEVFNSLFSSTRRFSTWTQPNRVLFCWWAEDNLELKASW